VKGAGSAVPKGAVVLNQAQLQEAAVLREWVRRSVLLQVRAEDGMRLAGRMWEVGAGSEERGAVLLVHGFGEQTARYPHVARHLVGHGYRVVGFDLRGHGQSGGVRGQLRSYTEWLEDLSVIASELGVGRGWYLVGHSLGAQIAINWLTATRLELSGVVLLSPWFRLARRPSLMKVALARMMSGVLPRFTQQTGHGLDHLSRDLPFVLSLPGRALNHRTMSARMYVECANGARRAYANGTEVGGRMLMMHGTDDWLTSPRATAEVGARVTRREHRVELVDGGRHELHNDLGRERFLQRVTRWMDAEGEGRG